MPRRFTEDDFADSPAPRRFTEDDFADGPSQAESAFRGTLQGGTFNFADEAVATLGAGLVKGAQGVAQGLDALGIKDLPEGADLRSFGDIRQQILGEERARNDAAQAANPGTFLAGEFAGGVASPIPLGKARAAGTAAKGLGALVRTGAAQGAKAGALAGLGASEADLTEGEFGQAALDTLVGGAGGAVLGGFIPAAATRLGQTSGAKAAREAAKVTREYLAALGEGVKNKLAPLATEAGQRFEAGIQAVKAAGLQGVADLRRLGDAKYVSELGNWAMDVGLVSRPLKRLDRDSIANAAEGLQKSSGEAIGALRQAAQQAGFGPRADVLIRGIEDMTKKLRKLSDLDEAARVLSVASQAKKTIEKNTQPDGRVSGEFLDEAKRLIDSGLFPQEGQGGNKLAKLSEAAGEMRLKIRNLFRDEEEKAVSQLGSGVRELFKEAKEAYGKTSDLLYLAGRQEARDVSNVAISLRDTLILSGNGGVLEKLPGGAAIAYLGKQVGDIAGNATAATGLRGAAELNSKIQSFGRDFAASPVTQAASNLSERLLRELSEAQRTGGIRGLANAGAALISANPDQRDAIMSELRRRQANIQSANASRLGL